MEFGRVVILQPDLYPVGRPSAHGHAQGVAVADIDHGTGEVRAPVEIGRHRAAVGNGLAGIGLGCGRRGQRRQQRQADYDTHERSPTTIIGADGHNVRSVAKAVWAIASANSSRSFPIKPHTASIRS